MKAERIKVHRVKQYCSKSIFVVCVDSIPLCTVRGKNALNRIIQKLCDADVSLEDKRIEAECEFLNREETKDAD